MARVVSLHRYPLKGARAEDIATVALTEQGLQHDRRWMVVDPQWRFVTQRECSALARIVAVPRPGGLQLSLDSLHATLEVPEPPADQVGVTVSVWRSRPQALDAGDAAATWLTNALARPVRLVFSGGAFSREANRDYTDGRRVPVAFPDGYPILVANAASLADLNARMPETVPMSRFRPNIVIDGLAPWAEDHIRRVQLAGVTLQLCKPCTRCTVPSLDQLSGAASFDPTPTLKTFRFDRRLRGVTFGQNAFVVAGVGATLHVGASGPCEFV